MARLSSKYAARESSALLAGTRDILIITTPHDREQLVRPLDDGPRFEISLAYTAQPEPNGLHRLLFSAPTALVRTTWPWCWETASSMGRLQAHS